MRAASNDTKQKKRTQEQQTSNSKNSTFLKRQDQHQKTTAKNSNCQLYSSISH